MRSVPVRCGATCGPCAGLTAGLATSHFVSPVYLYVFVCSFQDTSLTQDVTPVDSHASYIKWTPIMTTPTHPAKRRRLAAVHKPFRSPMQAHDPNRPGISTPSTLAPRRHVTSPLPARSSVQSSRDFSPEAASQSCVQPDPRSASYAIVRTPQSGTRPKLRYPSDPLNPTAHRLEISIAQLKTQLAAIQSEVEILSRARRIRDAKTSDQNVLPAQIAKWKLVAQTAADALFPSFKERAGVEAQSHQGPGVKAGMGASGGTAGLGTGFENEEEQAELLAGLKRIQDGVNEHGEPMGLAEREERAMVLERMSRVDAKGDDPLQSDDSDEIDMGVMLRVLNVDFKTVGWDAERQDWIT